jgi:hypothetical protein
MLPAWFIHTISEILKAREPKNQALPQMDSKESISESAISMQVQGLTLVKAEKKASPQREKVDESLNVRRLKRAVENQLVQEFGVGVLHKLSLITKQ